jgi:hypothetical protein
MFDVTEILSHRATVFSLPLQTLVLYFSTRASNFYGFYKAAMLQGQVALVIKLFCLFFFFVEHEASLFVSSFSNGPTFLFWCNLMRKKPKVEAFVNMATEENLPILRKRKEHD